MSILNKILGNASETSIEDLTKKYRQLISESEQIELGFTFFRDVFMFTSKRLIVVEVQGLTGKKITYLSLPYRNISRFSLETAGTFDLDAELKIWISSEAQPSISRRFNKSVNVYEVQQLLATHVLK